MPMLKVIPLGGLGEVGKNMTVLEYEDEILIVDCGMSFPDDEMFGIDAVIPDFNYVLDQNKTVRAVVITHGHEDHRRIAVFIGQNRCAGLWHEAVAGTDSAKIG